MLGNRFVPDVALAATRKMLAIVLFFSLVCIWHATTAFGAGSGDDERVARGYQQLVEVKPGEAIRSLSAPFIEAANSGDKTKSSRYLLLLAFAFRQDDNDAAAAQCAELAVKLNPSDIHAIAMASGLLFRSGQIDKAQRMWDQLEQSGSNDPVVIRALGIESWTRGNYDLAISRLTEAARLDPLDLQSPARLASIYQYRQNSEKAAQFFDQCSKIAPGEYQKKIFSAMAAEERKQYPEAEKLLKEAGAINPDDPNWHNNLAMDYMMVQKGDLARQHFQQALTCPRLSFGAAVHTAAFLIYCGQPIKATKILRKLVAFKPYSADAHYALGSYYKITGRLNEAEKELRRAIELNPRKPQSYMALLGLDRINGDDGKVKDLLDLWASQGCYSWECESALGAFHLKNKEWAEAKQALLKAEAGKPGLIPDDSALIVRFCRLYAGLTACYYHENDFEKAFDYARLFNQLKPKPEERGGVPLRPPAFDFAAHKADSNAYRAAQHGAIADALFETKDYDGATREYNEALSLEPKNIVWHGSLLKVCLDKRDVVAAAKEDAVVAQQVINNTLRTIDFSKKKAP